MSLSRPPRNENGDKCVFRGNYHYTSMAAFGFDLNVSVLVFKSELGLAIDIEREK